MAAVTVVQVEVITTATAARTLPFVPGQKTSASVATAVTRQYAARPILCCAANRRAKTKQAPTSRPNATGGCAY